MHARVAVPGACASTPFAECTACYPEGMTTLDALDEAVAPCADCGAELQLGRSRECAIANETYLCFACALRRGGSYDEAHDRWTTAPRTDGLPAVT